MSLLEALAEQEERLVFTSFTNEDALALGTLMVDAAREQGLPVVVSVRRGRQRLFHAALPGTSADNDGWIERKSRVVDRYGRSSFWVGESFRAQGKSFEADSYLDPREYSAHGGVFPVNIAGVGLVGTVGVSGLPQADDHAFVVAQVERFLTTAGQ
ncbi:heme-degrading domain-containing protein [Actinosynnema sp. CS-041913]|uniref:heme-degrading domain-containing protein n=1 Tax=Actinosynnema sp. CS-041913 TaxID=3239917 RepID=UPI003D928F7F